MTFAWSTNALSINDASAVFFQVNELGFMSPVFTHHGGRSGAGTPPAMVDVGR
jgi:hypothetical protein